MLARIKLVSLLFSLVFLLPAAASADRIITIDEVANRVKVRHRPGLESPAIGSLQYNESAELLESLPYWYHIRLDNGVPGYISRAWARKLSEAEGDGEVVRAGYWKLGAPNQGSMDFKAIVKAIQANFDVLAVAGLAQASQPGYDALLKALGPEWAALTGEASPAAHEKPYAILYRSAIVRPCAGWQSLTYFNPAEEAQPGANAASVAFGCFEAPLNKSSMGIDFMLGVYLAPEDGANGDLLKSQVGQLDDVIAAARAARPAERDIILGGTFNLSAPELQNAVDARVRTKGAGSILGAAGEVRGLLHDHMIIMDQESTIETIDAPQVVDVRAAAGSNQEFYRSCSDHLPVILRLRTTGPDDD